jgi:hypothetical protein
MTYQKNEVILEAENVGLQYGDKVILREINFELHNITRPDVTQRHRQNAVV